MSLWVKPSSFGARHESLNIWCSQREDAQKCWETQIAGQFDNQNDNSPIWQTWLSIHQFGQFGKPNSYTNSQFQNKWCDGGVAPSFPKRKSAEPRSLLGILTVGGPVTSDAHRRWEEIRRYCCHTNELKRWTSWDFPHGFSMDLFGDF